MSKWPGKRKQCTAEALGKKESGEGKQFLWRKDKRMNLSAWHQPSWRLCRKKFIPVHQTGCLLRKVNSVNVTFLFKIFSLTSAFKYKVLSFTLLTMFEKIYLIGWECNFICRKINEDKINHRVVWKYRYYQSGNIFLKFVHWRKTPHNNKREEKFPTCPPYWLLPDEDESWKK